MARIGIITGVRREADCLSDIAQDPNITVCIAGADPFRAGNLAAHLLTKGVDGVVSFGLCGGLDPDLNAGDLILPNRIIASGEKTVSCDADWTGRIAEKLGDLVTRSDVTLAYSGTIVTDPRRKAMLRAHTDAVCVDMESLAVGLAAKRANKPFAVIRAVSDTAGTDLPSWTDEIVSEAGGTDGLSLLKNLAAHPGDLGKLLTLGQGGTKALKVLRSAAGRLGPGFAFS